MLIWVLEVILTCLDGHFFCSGCNVFLIQCFVAYLPCPKISSHPASNMLNSVCSSCISTKYRTLHYLNITYTHAHYDVRTLPFVLSVTSS